MLGCINLQDIAKNRYQLGFDPAYQPRGKAKREPDPWMLVMPCKYGTIYPAGGDRLRWMWTATTSSHAR